MKKILFMSLAASAVAVAQADYLLWTVQDSDISTFQEKYGLSVSSIRVGQVEAGSSIYAAGEGVTSYATDGTSLGSGGLAYGGDTGFDSGDQFKLNISDLGVAYSYYIELLNESGAVIGRSVNSDTKEFETYESLASKAVTGSIGDVPPAKAVVWHGGSFVAVPEPSSMALLALGAGLVGLRRKLRGNRKGKRA